MKRKYNPNSKRSIAGKQFQDKVLFELKNYFSDIEDFRDRKRNQGVERGTPYTESELSILEKSFGDLTFTIDGHLGRCNTGYDWPLLSIKSRFYSSPSSSAGKNSVYSHSRSCRWRRPRFCLAYQASRASSFSRGSYVSRLGYC